MKRQDFGQLLARLTERVRKLETGAAPLGAAGGGGSSAGSQVFAKQDDPTTEYALGSGSSTLAEANAVVFDRPTLILWTAQAKLRTTGEVPGFVDFIVTWGTAGVDTYSVPCLPGATQADALLMPATAPDDFFAVRSVVMVPGEHYIGLMMQPDATVEDTSYASETQIFGIALPGDLITGGGWEGTGV